jgi:hypothetical protein
LFLFSEGREKFGEPLASDLAGDGVDEAVAALRTFALVDRETIADERDPKITTETIRLHRLVRAVAAERFEGEASEAARRFSSWRWPGFIRAMRSTTRAPGHAHGGSTRSPSVLSPVRPRHRRERKRRHCLYWISWPHTGDGRLRPMRQPALSTTACVVKGAIDSDREQA